MQKKYNVIVGTYRLYKDKNKPSDDKTNYIQVEAKTKSVANFLFDNFQKLGFDECGSI